MEKYSFFPLDYLKEFEIPKRKPLIIAEITNAHNDSTTDLEKLVNELDYSIKI